MERKPNMVRAHPWRGPRARAAPRGYGRAAHPGQHWNATVRPGCCKKRQRGRGRFGHGLHEILTTPTPFCPARLAARLRHETTQHAKPIPH
eukprot:2579549-Lingulodinium_polyedra.AAC.1